MTLLKVEGVSTRGRCSPFPSSHVLRHSHLSFLSAADLFNVRVCVLVNSCNALLTRKAVAGEWWWWWGGGIQGHYAVLLYDVVFQPSFIFVCARKCACLCEGQGECAHVCVCVLVCNSQHRAVLCTNRQARSYAFELHAHVQAFIPECLCVCVCTGRLVCISSASQHSGVSGWGTEAALRRALLWKIPTSRSMYGKNDNKGVCWVFWVCAYPKLCKHEQCEWTSLQPVLQHSPEHVSFFIFLVVNCSLCQCNVFWICVMGTWTLTRNHSVKLLNWEKMLLWRCTFSVINISFTT